MPMVDNGGGGGGGGGGELYYKVSTHFHFLQQLRKYLVNA